MSVRARGVRAGVTAFVATRAGGVPLVVLAAIAAAWAVSVAAAVSGVGAHVHHDALLAHGAPPLLGVRRLPARPGR